MGALQFTPLGLHLGSCQMMTRTVVVYWELGRILCLISWLAAGLQDGETVKTSECDDEQASQATSSAHTSSASRVSLGAASQGGRSPGPRAMNVRRYKARVGAKKPSIRLDKILPTQSLLVVCVKAAMFLLGALGL